MTEPRLHASSTQESMGLEYFSTPSRLGLIQQIAYVLQFGEGLPVVQGAAGSGKTFLASELASSLGSEAEVARVNLSEKSHLDGILRDIVLSLALDTDKATSPGELLVSLRRYVRELEETHQLAVVIVDNAHFLDESSLGALLSLVQGDYEPGKGLRMVFFARPGLVEQIDELQLVDIAVFDFDVPMMSAAELKGFIADFYPDLATFSQEKITQAWNESGGNPGSAIQILSQYEKESSKGGFGLTLPKFEGFSLAQLHLPVKHILLLIVMVVIFIWALLVRNTSQPEVIAPPKASVPLPDKEVDTIVEGEQVVSELEIAEATEVQQAAQTQQISKGATPWPKVVDVPSATPGPKVQEQVAALPAPQKPATKVASTGNLNLSKKGGSPAHSADEQHLLEQPPEYFTLQVLSSVRSLSLSSYLLRQKNRKQLYLYRSLRKGQRRYVVVAGIYKTRQEATAAIATLPREQQKAGPWPRSLKSVQREIEQF